MGIRLLSFLFLVIGLCPMFSYARVIGGASLSVPSSSSIIVSFTGSKGSISIDMAAFQKHWLDQVNTTRSALKIYPYEADKQLDFTAQYWSDYSKSIGSISHKRYNSKTYYDYNLIRKRFESLGIVFGPKNGTKVVENIGRWYVRCATKKFVKTDCTQTLINAAQSTRTFFMSEKGKAYAPHYKSIISRQYTHAWFGITIDVDKGKYYLTTHYSVPLESKDKK